MADSQQTDKLEKRLASLERMLEGGKKTVKEAQIRLSYAESSVKDLEKKIIDVKAELKRSGRSLNKGFRKLEDRLLKLKDE